MIDYSNWSADQLQETLELRAGEVATDLHDAELRVFEEEDGTGRWTAGYLVPGKHGERCGPGWRGDREGRARADQTGCT